MANSTAFVSGLSTGFAGGIAFSLHLYKRHLECHEIGKAMIKAEKDYQDAFAKMHQRKYSAAELVKMFDEAEGNQRKYNQEYHNRCLGLWAKAFKYIPKSS